jgi:hypothetical protein
MRKFVPGFMWHAIHSGSWVASKLSWNLFVPNCTKALSVYNFWFSKRSKRILLHFTSTT